MGDMDNARYMKRKVKAGEIEPDPNDLAIIVNYEVEATIIGDDGTPMMMEKKHNKKKIRVNDLNMNTNIPVLADEIVEKCRLIHISKMPQVINILYHLQQRAMMDPESDNRRADEMRKKRSRKPQNDHAESEAQYGVARIDKLDTYLEYLYEEPTEDKLKGTSLILQLTRNVENLEVLAQEEPLLSALGRLLRDERKSTELMMSLVAVWQVFSAYSQFHPLITQYRVGDLVMRIVDLETKRQNLWLDELEKLRSDVLAGKKTEDDFNKDKKKTRAMMKRQDRLLTVCFHLLLNLAEDIAIERKMKKRKIVSYLMAMLERRNAELLVVVISFLKKLSIFSENKDEMAEDNIIKKLATFVPVQNETLMILILQLLGNLAFDPTLRKQIAECNLIPKVVDMVHKRDLQVPCLRLLYQLSMDDSIKSTFSYTEIIPIMMRLIIEYPEQYVGKELVALGINLACNARIAELICEGDGLHQLMKRGLKTKDPLLFKMVRNLAEHDGAAKPLFKNYLPELCRIAGKTRNQDVLVEILGILGALQYNDVKYSRLADEYNLIEFVKRHIAPGAAEDDVVLSVVIFLGTMLSDSKVVAAVVRADLISPLFEIMTEKQEDDEIVLQALFALYRLMLQKDARNQALNHTHVVPFLIDLLQDKTPEIREMSDHCCDIIMENDEEWARRIRLRKFQSYNAEWLDAIDDDEDVDAFYRDNKPGYDDDDDDYGGWDEGAGVRGHHPNVRLYGDEDDLYDD